MHSDELNSHITALRLDYPEVAQLLGISSRTLRRWLEEAEEVPKPAEAALRAWLVLDKHNLPWKPDSVSIFENDQNQIERHLKHTQELAALLKRVEAKGGPKNLWTVDLTKCTATFGPFEVGFYKLQPEGFSLSSYRRKDILPDPERDMVFIEDAAYSIAKAFSRAREGSAALKALANHTRNQLSSFVVNGTKLLNSADAERQKKIIGALADQVDELAVMALEGQVKYENFEVILGELHSNGFFPEISLISNVARAFIG